MKDEYRITPATMLTISRFALVPVFIYFFLAENFQFAVGTLILASVTDMLDGFLARHFNMRSELGSMLDPLADKFMMTVSFIVLTGRNMIPWIVTAIILGRDFYIVWGVYFLGRVKRIKLVFKPTRLSKVTTFSHFMLLSLSFITYFVIRRSIALESKAVSLLFHAQYAFIFIAAGLTLVTFVQYTFVGIHFLKFGERTAKQE
jgi:cardiolipin synthase